MTQLNCLLVSALAMFVQADSSAQQPGASQTLYEMAKDYHGKGHLIVSSPSSSTETFSSVKKLATRSHELVVGTPARTSTRLSADGRRLETIVWLKVHSAPLNRRHIAPGEIVKVRFEGGVYRYRDGTIVEVALPNMKVPWNPKRKYVMFLNFSHFSQGAWELVGGAESCFEFNAQKRTVTPVDLRAGSTFRRMYSEMPFRSFLAAVKQ